MGIALAWRQEDELPTLHRLRELAVRVAHSRSTDRAR
jgi:hypothetical protein